MLTTRITELFGIEHPVVQCGVDHASGPELVAAVSNAGGLGLLPAGSYDNADELAKGIGRTFELTKNPFGVSFGFWVGNKDMDPESLFEMVRSQGVNIVELSAISSYVYTEQLKSWGIRVIHTCKTVKDARNSQKSGCDAVILEGIESQGWGSDLDIGSISLLASGTQGLKIPVIASGGIADGRGLVAALALGADGVAMTTRFMMTSESAVNPGVKGYLLQALEGDTILVEPSPKKGLRVLKTPVSEKVYLQKKRGQKPDPIDPDANPLMTGDFSGGLLPVGQSIGLIRDIPTVEVLMKRITEEAQTALERVHLLFG